MCFTWCSNNETAWCAEGPEFDSGYNLFFFFFSCFLFFSFPLRLVFILVFVVFFYLFIWLMFFFRFINFLSYCFTSTSCRSPESFARSCDSRISSWKVCFTQCTVFFPKRLFSIADLLPRVICGSYVTEINSVLWHSTRQTFASLGLFTFARTACLSILATLTTVFVDTRLSKTKHPRKSFQNFRQSCMLSTDRIEIHQSQPLVWPSDLLYVM